MKTRINLLSAVTLLSLIFSLSCKKKDTEPELKGNPGNPRFNLQFTNEANVDLDLYVKTPNGTTIYYSSQFGQGGELDVDCLCSTCPNGPNENIFWVDGTAPAGKYTYWVKYYGKCTSGATQSSDYTLRLVRNNKILETYTGTLSTVGSMSPVYTYTK